MRQDPDVADRFLLDGPQLTTPVDFKVKVMERGDARVISGVVRKRRFHQKDSE